MAFTTSNSLVRYTGNNTSFVDGFPYNNKGISSDKIVAISGIFLGIINTLHMGEDKLSLTLLVVNFAFRVSVIHSRMKSNDEAVALLSLGALFLFFFPYGGFIAIAFDIYFLAFCLYAEASYKALLDNPFDDGNPLNPKKFADACQILDIPKDKVENQAWVIERLETNKKGFEQIIENGKRKKVEVTCTWAQRQIEKHLEAYNTIASHQKWISN